MIDHVAADFVGTMNHRERKATEIALQIVAVAHFEAAGIVEETELIGTEEVVASFGSEEHVTAVGTVVVGSFVEFWGLVVTGNDGHEVHVESLACIGMVVDSG